MPTQHQLDTFTLAFHREAMARLRAQPSLVQQAIHTLERWDAQRGATASQPYLTEWKRLLEQGVDAVDDQVCRTTPEAATLRNVSPLGFVLSPAERMALRRMAVQ